MPKERKNRAPLDPTEKRIPRPMNMFLFYRGEQIRLAAERGLAGQELKDFTNVVITDTWKVMDKGARRKYELMAEHAKEEHARMYPDYKYRPRTAEDKEVEKEYKKELKRKAQEARQTGKRVARGGRKRPESVDSEIREIKKEEALPQPSPPKQEKTFSARRRTSTEKYHYYSASSFGTGGPPPDWYRVSAGPSSSSSSNNPNPSSYHQGQASQVVYSANQPMYSHPPMMSLPYPFNRPPPPGSVYPGQLSAPSRSLPMPALTDSALEHGGTYEGSPPMHDADSPEDEDEDDDNNSGATPESGRFSEPVYPNLWNGFDSGVNAQLAAPSENFNDYVRFPEDGGAGDSPPSPPPLVASLDYANWKTASLDRDRDLDGRSVSVEVTIPENVANGGGQASQALADQMMSQMNMAAPAMQQQQQQDQNQLSFNVDVNINPGTGQVDFLQNVAFDPTAVLSAFLPVPSQGSSVAYGGVGNVNAVAGGGSGAAGRQLPYIHAGVPQFYKPQEGEDFSAWNQALGDGFDGGTGFMSGDLLSPESAMNGGGGPGGFDLQVDPATAQAFFDMIIKSGSGPAPAPGSEEEQSRLLYQEIKQHNPEWLVQMGEGGQGPNEGDCDGDAVEDMDRDFGGAMSFEQRRADFAADERPSVVYHCSPPPRLTPPGRHNGEHEADFPAPSYNPPSGASNYSGRRVAGNWKQQRPQMDRVSSMQSAYSDQDHQQQQRSSTSPTVRSPRTSMSGPSYAPASSMSTYRYPPSSASTTWYQPQQQEQPQSGMMTNLNTSMAFAGNGNSSSSPTSYMAVPQTMRQVATDADSPPPVKMESRPTRSILSGPGSGYGGR